jgi:hypothetical protein
MNFDPSKLKEVKSFEDEKKYTEYFGLESTQTFEQKKEILQRLERERKIVVKSRTKFSSSFEKTVLVASVGTVISLLSKLFDDGVGHFTLNFFIEESQFTITFYFVDIKVAVKQVPWWILYLKSEKNIITIKILNIVEFSFELDMINSSKFIQLYEFQIFS